MPRSKMMRLVGIIHLLCNNDVGGEYLCIVDCQIIFTNQDCALPYCWPFLQVSKSCGATQIGKELSVSNCGLIFPFIVSKEQVEDRWEVLMLVKYLLLSIMFTLFLSTTQIFHVWSRNLTYIHRMTNQLHYVERVLHWDLWHCSPFRSNIDHHI